MRKQSVDSSLHVCMYVYTMINGGYIVVYLSIENIYQKLTNLGLV